VFPFPSFDLSFPPSLLVLSQPPANLPSVSRSSPSLPRHLLLRLPRRSRTDEGTFELTLTFLNSSHSANTKFMCLSNASICPIRLRPSFLYAPNPSERKGSALRRSEDGRREKHEERRKRWDGTDELNEQGDLETVVDEGHHPSSSFRGSS